MCIYICIHIYMYTYIHISNITYIYIVRSDLGSRINFIKLNLPPWVIPLISNAQCPASQNLLYRVVPLLSNAQCPESQKLQLVPLGSKFIAVMSKPECLAKSKSQNAVGSAIGSKFVAVMLPLSGSGARDGQ